ncbi:MAG: hypothetical protein K2M78_11975 [Lachnospiraceae bacterium]|nr:hypothetical protein [Lachnospiraceae bacterium]
MRIINKRQVFDLIYKYGLIPKDKCFIVNQENGDIEEVKTCSLNKLVSSNKNPVFKTDDDGVIKIVTLDIHYNYLQNNLESGYLIRILLYRLKQKRMQNNLLSNGVGAPTCKKLHS